MKLFNLLLKYQNDNVPKSTYVRIKLINNTSIKYVYVPLPLYTNIFIDARTAKINLYFDCDIGIESMISYICDMNDMVKQLNVTYGSNIDIEKYIISRYEGLKKYQKHCFPINLSPDSFSSFINIISKYGSHVDDVLEQYYRSELPMNIYLIDKVHNLPREHLLNKIIFIKKQVKYNIFTLSKYRFVYYRDSVKNMLCFSIKIINGSVYMKGPFKVDYYELHYGKIWHKLDSQYEYIEQNNIYCSELSISLHDDAFLWSGSFQYILDMQDDEEYRKNCIKLKVQDDISDDLFIYIPKHILLEIDHDYFNLATDVEYIKHFGDIDPSIYFSGNQTIGGFLRFLGHYLDNDDKRLYLMSEEDIDLYTYYHRFNLHHALDLSFGISKQKFVDLLDSFGIDGSEIELYGPSN